MISRKVLCCAFFFSTKNEKYFTRIYLQINELLQAQKSATKEVRFLSRFSHVQHLHIVCFSSAQVIPQRRSDIML